MTPTKVQSISITMKITTCQAINITMTTTTTLDFRITMTTKLKAMVRTTVISINLKMTTVIIRATMTLWPLSLSPGTRLMTLRGSLPTVSIHIGS